MALLRIATNNVLEGAGVTLASSGITINTSFPLSRLNDRSVNRYCQGVTTASAYTGIFTASGAGAAGYASALIVPEGHTIAGATLAAKHSANGTDYTTAGSITAAAGVNVIEWARRQEGYWRAEVAMNGTVKLHELFFSDVYTFERAPARPSGALEVEFNVKEGETSSGSARFIEYGPSRRRRFYSFPNVSEAMADEVASRLNGLGGKKPFYLCDHEGSWIFCQLTGPVAPMEIVAGRFAFDLNVLEVI